MTTTMSDVNRGLLSGTTTDLQAALKAEHNDFSFRSELSLAPLIRFWTDTTRNRSAKGTVARIVADEVAKAPELLETIEDASVFERHRDLVDVLMAAVFPPAGWEQEYGAANIPFQLRGFYATPLMQRLLLTEDGALRGRVNLDARMVGIMRTAYAYALILRRLYGVEINVDHEIILTVADPETGLDRHFRLLIDWQFVDVETLGSVPPLREAVRQRLQAHLLDTDMLREVLPPEKFVFRGVTIFRAVEVTDQEVLSAIKLDLIDRESIVSNTRFLGLQDKLRTLFRRPELRLGVAALDGDRVLLLNYGSRHEHGCIFADSAHHKMSEFAGSLYERAVLEGQPVIADDLTRLASRTHVEEQIIQNGLRSFIAAPLRYQDKVIGTLGLSSPNPGDLDATHLPKLHEVLPLFSMAVQRSMEELNARIQTQIKEKFTAIHPSVEWRFRQAVLNTIERRVDGAAPEMEAIVFRDVYPLYGACDIRGSSTQRNLTIQADLSTHLGLAREVVQRARDVKHLPILDELAYRIDKQLTHMETDLHSGDEVTILAFLRQHVEPLFEHIAGFDASVRERVEAYRAALDPQVGTVYRKRKDYEDSVTAINEAVSAYLDAEQEMAQAMFPHYFEKQRTDGVDYSIYVGASLVDGRAYDELYLRNLRLWQLLVACGIARQTEVLRQRLPLPLETTHLILAHHAPLSIRFRFDEKRFDVDGAYNVRYEVIKKRIDKAMVRSSDERVTQPGRMAIVYAQPVEAQEYREYLDYLMANGYVTGPVEELELDELQGVHGLRALRVAVDLSVPPRAPHPALEEAAQALRALKV